jgi:broad specificity phosphatase PhoE
MHATAATPTSNVSPIATAGAAQAANNPSITLATGHQTLHECPQIPVVRLADVPSYASFDIFIRHGKTPDNHGEGETYVVKGQTFTAVDKVLSGQNKVGLTDVGFGQGIRSGVVTERVLGRDRLAQARHVRSPQVRVGQTFQGYKQGAGLTNIELKVTEDPRQMERSAGKLTDLTRKEAATRWPQMATGATFKEAEAAYPEGVADDGKWYPGESLRIVGDRAVPAMEEHRAQDGDVVFLGHEMEIKTKAHHLESGCAKDHVEESCTTNDAFDHQVDNATPMVYARYDGQTVKVDISEVVAQVATEEAAAKQAQGERQAA